MAAGPLQHASLRSGGGEREEAAPNWASLHAELTHLISVRVLATGDFLDYIRFRAVCSHWRAAAASPRGRSLLDSRFHPRHWMLFPEGFGRFPGHRALGGHARFFNLSAAGPLVRVPLPELKDHCVLDSPDGLLLLQHDGDNAVRLLHPFSREVAEFPDLKCLAHQLYEMDHDLSEHWYNFASWLQNTARYMYQSRKLCAAVNVTTMGTVTVMLVLHNIGRVAFASAGDAEWTISSWKMNQLDRVLSYQGKLYVVNWEDGLTYVLQIDPPQLVPQCKGGEDSSPVLALPPPKTIATCSSEEIHQPYLVELDSEIMLVGYNDSSFSHLLVLKLADFVLGRTVCVKSIGDHVLFVGARSLCVSPSWLPLIGGNSIVCFHAGENYLAQYHLGSGTWSVASDGHLMLSPPPRPCGLIHHIFTCCYRQFWNKGLMFCFKMEPKWWAMSSLRNGARRLFHREDGPDNFICVKSTRECGFHSFACISMVNLRVCSCLYRCLLTDELLQCRLNCNCGLRYSSVNHSAVACCVDLQVPLCPLSKWLLWSCYGDGISLCPLLLVVSIWISVL